MTRAFNNINSVTNNAFMTQSHDLTALISQFDCTNQSTVVVS